MKVEHSKTSVHGNGPT